MNLNSPIPASLAMSDVAAALSDVANGSDDQPAALIEPSRETRSLSPARQTARRRSSSRVDAAPHNVRDEEPPEDRFHNAAVQQGFASAKALMQSLAAVLGSSSLHVEPDSAMRRLHERAGELGRFQCPSTRIVGFVGDSGVGAYFQDLS